MTSQKRYRHHQDGGSNRDRFKDIPPRFKRQKSSSSPTRAQSPSNGEKNNETTHTHESDFPQLESATLSATAATLSATAATAREPSSPSVYEFKDKVTSHFGSRSDKMQSQPLPSPATWDHPKDLDSIYVSSPWNNQGYLSVGFQQPKHVALGTHFGYKADLSPLYSWAPVDSPQLYGLSDVTEDPIWTNVYADQRGNLSPGYIVNNENLTSRQYMHPLKPQDSCWDYPTSTRYPAAASPPANISSSPLPIESNEKKNHNKKTDTFIDKQIVDYSDPDIRTIEMLRELERVADQKERENEEFGADRKSLVSHHLRMLMCAVDRYTEGIEDDLAMISRHDEVRPATDSRGSTPGVSADAVSSTAYEQTSDVTRSTIRQSPSLQSPRFQEHSVWDELLISPKTNKLTNQTQDSYVLSSHTPPLLSEQSVAGGNITAAWDLWSSPTFDFCDVLTNHSPDISRVRSVRERRPLYERQVQNY
ncbi:hypothetical protein BsWGS_19463 [Bradybaena similaris]